LVFLLLSKVVRFDRIFVIGNSFGFGTFVLADLFPQASIDVIDAEIEGLDVKLGSELTRKIAAETFTNVNLTKGFSPQDLPTAVRSSSYDFVFIDGLHTNEQVWKDWQGMKPYLDKCSVVYFHDIASCNLFESWAKIQADAAKIGFRAWNLGFTQMGCGMLTRGSQDLDNYLSLLCNEFNGPYKIGFSDEAGAFDRTRKRPFFWDLSFGHLERLMRRKLRRLLGRE
jgi:hypothetical protein